jgi:hypothetical protein
MFMRITRPDGAIRTEEVDSLIAKRDDLQAIADSRMINPFTKEPITSAGTALYLRQGKPVGNLTVEDGDVLTTGIPRSVCEELAELLGAAVHKDDRS